MVSTLIWVLSGLLAAMFLMAGSFKAFKIDEAAAKMSWVDKFGRGNASKVGMAEMLGALGLVLPIALDVVPIISGIAAVCLAILMAGAVMMHFKWGEQNTAPLPAVLGITSAVLAYLHFA